jgi:hypothetical protein
MRLTREKIESLSRQLLHELKSRPDVKLLADESLAQLEIKSVIAADLRREDEIDGEVREILKKHSDRISRENMDYTILFRKIKQQMMRERDLVL